MLLERLGVPGSAVVELPDAGEDRVVDGVRRLPEVTEAADRIRDRVASLEDAPLLVGGECGIEWGAIGAGDRSGTAVVWLDAHPDLNTPASSPSGSFHGMVLRHLIDGGLPAANVVLGGTRSIDPPEQEAIDELGIAVIRPDSLVDGVLATLTRIDPQDVWVHIDLDVLDPSEFSSLGFPEPGGVGLDALLSLVAQIRERWPLAGAAVTEYLPAPGDEGDLETVVRVVESLR